MIILNYINVIKKIELAIKKALRQYGLSFVLTLFYLNYMDSKMIQ